MDSSQQRRQLSIVKPLSFVRRLLAASALAISAACGSATPSHPEIKLVVPSGHAEKATIAVAGVPSRYLPAPSSVSAEQWPEILRVTVGDAAPDMPPVAGAYSVRGSEIVFTPLFGFEPGVQYRVEFSGAKLPATAVGNDAWSPTPIVINVGLPGRDVTPVTVVDHVFPSSDVVPENQLRLYVHFSAPMGRKGGLEYVHLLDEKGLEVAQPFLPLDAEFWNADRTRYTVFFDPGRVKRGILPNEQMGRPLIAGHVYTLVVDSGWKDGNGALLKQEFRKTFRVGPADMRPLDTKTWQLRAPAAGTREPLTVTFPEPLDHGLLMRALGVANGTGQPLSGDAEIASNETQWGFRPAEAWKSGAYQLIVLTILEDMAGNRVGRAFEVDEFERVDPQAEQERVMVPFAIK